MTDTPWHEPPDKYYRDMLHIMVRDAHCLHAYWEIGNRKRWLVAQHFECDYHLMPKVLRVYDVTCIYFNGHNANRYFDVEVGPEANNWYIHPVNANATYVIDYGTYTWERQFIPILRSNFAATPADEEARMGEPIVPVLMEAYDSGTRIVPRRFENFAAFGIYARGGVYLDDQADAEEADLQRVCFPHSAHPSALYPS